MQNMFAPADSFGTRVALRGNYYTEGQGGGRFHWTKRWESWWMTMSVVVDYARERKTATVPLLEFINAEFLKNSSLVNRQ
jgi:hypothetical protein